MARTNRHHIPNCIWHITHRCHKRDFLLKFRKDKKKWINQLFEAKKRFGLSIRNFAVTSNHIHLLVVDTDKNAILKSIQLIAGRTGRGYNLRKKETAPSGKTDIMPLLFRTEAIWAHSQKVGIK